MSQPLDHELRDAEWLCGAPVRGPLAPTPPPAPRPDVRIAAAAHTAQGLLLAAQTLGDDGPRLRAWVFACSPSETRLIHWADIDAARRPEQHVAMCVGMLIAHRCQLLVLGQRRQGGLLLVGCHADAGPAALRGEGAEGAWRWAEGRAGIGDAIGVLATTAAKVARRRLFVPREVTP